MSTTQQKAKPTHRVSFARVIGQDDKGNDRLGSAREIGSVWPRQNSNGSIIRLDFIPIELTQHQGVLFLTPISKDGAQDAGN